jgi:hypothetical protein
MVLVSSPPYYKKNTRERDVCGRFKAATRPLCRVLLVHSNDESPAISQMLLSPPNGQWVRRASVPRPTKRHQTFSQSVARELCRSPDETVLNGQSICRSAVVCPSPDAENRHSLRLSAVTDEHRESLCILLAPE